MSEKVKMNGEMSKVELINIAGIRNKQQQQEKAQKIKPKRVQFPLLEEDGEAQKETEQLPGEVEAMDVLDDDQWFLEAVKAQDEGTGEPKKMRQQENFLKKINQIKGLTVSQKTDLLRLQKSIVESERNISLKDSRKVSSAIGSEDFEGNFTKNSHSHLKADRSLQSGTVFDDSDFVSKKRNSQKSPSTSGSKGPGFSRQKSIGDKVAMKKGLRLKNRFRNVNNEIKEENEQEEEAEKPKAPEGADPNKQLATLMTEEDVIEIEQEEKHLVIDLRRLKVQPIKERSFSSNSYNDVLGPQILREKKKQEDEEMRQIKENRIKIVHSLTRAEEAAVLARKQRKDQALQKVYTRLAIKPSTKSMEYKQQQWADRQLDEEVNAALGGTNSEKAGSMRSKTFAFGRSKNKGGGSLQRRFGHSNSKASSVSGKSLQRKAKTEEQQLTDRKEKEKEKEEEEEDLTEEQQKDYFAVLRRMQTPFSNEKEDEDSEEFKKKHKVFEFNEEYRNIRVNL